VEDFGPPADILFFRRKAEERLIPAVRVSNGYAVVDWYGGGGGEQLYHKLNDKWTLLQGGGGALGPADLRELGVPERVWCALGLADGPCTPSK